MAATGPATGDRPERDPAQLLALDPREARKRSTTQTAAAGTLANRIPNPVQLTTAATVPAQPCRRTAWPRAPGSGSSGSGPATSRPWSWPRRRRRRRRHRSPAGRAQPPVRQQQQREGDGQGDADRPEQLVADQDQVLGGRTAAAAPTAGRVDPRVNGDVGRPDQAGGGVQPADRVLGPPQGQDQADGGEQQPEGPSKAPLTIASVVSGRTTARVTTRPPSRQPMVASHSDQASRVRLRPPMGARGPRAAPVRDRYGPGSRARWLTYGQWRQPLSQQVPRSHR